VEDFTKIMGIRDNKLTFTNMHQRKYNNIIVMTKIIIMVFGPSSSRGGTNHNNIINIILKKDQQIKGSEPRSKLKLG
jgi:hypothetical protein